jgi:ABC-type uncharacterized transport system substrate-binding protein
MLAHKLTLRYSAMYDPPQIVPAEKWDEETNASVSYGASRPEVWRQGGEILKGAEPAGMPVVHSDKLELTINPATAKSLGLTFPMSLLAEANEVIE